MRNYISISRKIIIYTINIIAILAFLTELWYEEFLKLHPDYKSSKKNLWRKYKWYKSRMAEVKGENSANIPGKYNWQIYCDFTKKILGMYFQIDY